MCDEDDEATRDFFDLLDLDAKVVRRIAGRQNLLEEISSADSQSSDEECPTYNRYDNWTDEPFFSNMHEITSSDSFGEIFAYDSQDKITGNTSQSEESVAESISHTESLDGCLSEERLSRKRGRKSINLLEPAAKANLNPNGYLAQEFPAKKGCHPVYLYRNPENLDKCWAYQFKKQSASPDVIIVICSYCKSLDKNRGPTNKVDTVKRQFLTDPSADKHFCEAGNYAEEYARRTRFEVLQNIRAKPTENTAKEIFTTEIEKILDSDTLTADEKVDIGAQIGSFSKLKPQLCRAIKSNHEDESFTSLPDNVVKGAVPTVDEDFVHGNDSDGMMLFHPSLIMASSQLGITHIIADGTHGFVPNLLGRSGQIYSCHARLESGHYIPIFQALMKRKTVQDYLKVFSKLKEELSNAGCDIQAVTFLLDYEVAAIAALAKLFPKSQIEGCGFHWSMCMNRKGAALKQYKDDNLVSVWFSRMLAISFLPKEYFEMSGLLKVPVADSHPAYASCKVFLEYFKKTWIGREKLWSKFGILIRTTNAAESYHRAFKRLFKSNKNPSLVQILMYIRTQQMHKFLELQDQLKGKRVEKYTEPKEKAEEEEISAEFDRFQELVVTNNLTQQTVEDYLDRMTIFISRKAI